MDEPNGIVSLASKLHYIYGFLISLGSLPFIYYLVRFRQIPVFFGIRAFGDGFIERLGGLEALIVSSPVSVLASAMDILAAYWLARELRLGGLLALALFPINMFFAFGYNAPAPILLGFAKIIAVVVGWNFLR
jgi:hypothetical protein